MDEISVIVPMHNAEKTIKKAIDSVLQQSYENYEIILIDDESNDNTLQICKEIKEKNKNKKITIKNIKKSGPSVARNEGIKASNGKYLMFLDSDDYYEHNMLEIMYNEIKDKEQLLVCCNYFEVFNERKKASKIISNYEINGKNKLYKGIEYLQDNFKFNTLWNKIYYKSIIDKNNIQFDENISIGEDYRFNITYCNYITSIKYINKCLYYYVISQKSLCATYDKTDEFERRIDNINHNKEMYKENNYPLTNIYNKYISAIIGTIEVLISSKEIILKKKIEKIKYYMNYKDIQDALNVNFRVKKENKLIYELLKRNRYNSIYFYVFFRTMLKKIIYKLKGKIYRK